MLVPLLGRRTGVLGEVAAFWTAYVLTRPLGASIADWLAKPHSKAGGLGFTDALVSLVALVVFAGVVARVQRQHVLQRRTAPEATGEPVAG